MILQKAIFIGLTVIGLFVPFWDDMILEKLGNWLDTWVPEKIQKPLYRCFICGAFWWGALIYCLFFWVDIQEMFLVIICAMGFNAALSKIFINE